MKYNFLNAMIYEVCLFFTNKRPALKHNAVVRMILEHCFQDWIEWKTELTIRDVDRQVESIKEEWEVEENRKLLETFSEKYPDAKVKTHNEKTGAVEIQHQPDGSRAQDLLGGSIEIKSPWSE